MADWISSTSPMISGLLCSADLVVCPITATKARTPLTRIKRCFIMHGVLYSWTKIALCFEPVLKSFDPVVYGKMLLLHSKAMTPFFVHVQFSRLFCFEPPQVGLNILWRKPKLVIAGAGHKERSTHGRNSGAHH